MTQNLDSKTVTGFGEEWGHFNQADLTEDELNYQFNQYFEIFPWNDLPADAAGFDMGCGSGRWAKIAATKVGKLHCVDASKEALEVAKVNLAQTPNADFHLASVDSLPFADGSMDFAYSLGVLHHVPDTGAGIKSCVEKLKKGAPFLVYLYYRFDNRPVWFSAVWKLSDFFRRIICELPFALKRTVTTLIAFLVYFPLAKIAALLEKTGMNVDALPLSVYRHHSFYTMKTDALDRFGTRLEQRFTRPEIKEMMEKAGLENIRFNNSSPYWCAVGTRI